MGTVKIGDAISAGWNIYKDNFGLVFLGCLITWLVSAVSCNVCLGPLLSSRGFPGCPAFAYSIVKVQIRHDKKAVDLVTQKGKIDRLHLW